MDNGTVCSQTREITRSRVERVGEVVTDSPQVLDASLDLGEFLRRLGP